MSMHDTAPARVESGDNAAVETVVSPIDVNDPEIAVAVLLLQRTAYRVEAALIGFEQIPPLHESLDDLVAAPLVWRGIVESGEVVAAMGFTEDDGQIDIDRLFVSPRSSRIRTRLGLGGFVGPHSYDHSLDRDQECAGAPALRGARVREMR